MNILKLRKRLYRNNGSVLFIVLVIMSILIILATTTMYVVSNQHASIEVHYSSEQSYQAAKSLSQTVSDFLDKQFSDIKGRGSDVPITAYKDTLAGKIINGDSISSQDIDLSAFGYSNNGSAKIEITNNTGGPAVTLPDATRKYYEVKTTVTVNGETTTLTQLRHFDIGNTEYFTRFLTCTGNRPDDTSVSGGEIHGDAYFENSYTEFTEGNTTFRKSIYATGSVMDSGAKYEPKSGEYVESVIKGNYLINGPGGSEILTPYVFVGGNFINGGQDRGKNIKSKVVYVKGSYTVEQDNTNNGTKYFINGDCNIGTTATEIAVSKGTYYVNGELYFNTCDGTGNLGTFYVTDMSKVHYGPHYQNGATVIADPSKFEADIKGTNPIAGIESWKDVEDYIKKKTEKNTYQTWDAEKYFDNNLRSTAITIDPAVDLKNNSDGAYSDKYGNSGWIGCPIVYEAKADKTKALGIILKSFRKVNETDPDQSGRIVLDATDNDIYVYLDGGAENEFKMSSMCPILTKGDHSVIIIVPEDTDFTIPGFSFMGNVDLLKKVDSQFEDNSKTYNLWSPIQLNSSYHISNVSDVIAPQGTEMEADGLTAYLDDDGKISTEAYITASGANNNLFIVTKGTTNTIDVATGCVFGYLYAPNANLKVDQSSAGLSFVGGMIAGSYTYKNAATGLVYSKPKDYGNVYKGKDIVTHLMSVANSNGSPTPSKEVNLKDSGIGGDGYK